MKQKLKLDEAVELSEAVATIKKFFGKNGKFETMDSKSIAWLLAKYVAENFDFEE